MFLTGTVPDLFVNYFDKSLILFLSFGGHAVITTVLARVDRVVTLQKIQRRVLKLEVPFSEDSNASGGVLPVARMRRDV